MGNLSNYYAKTGKANPFATTTTDTESGVSQGGGFLKQYQQKNKLSSPFEVAKAKTITPIKVSQPKKPVETIQTKITSGVVKTGEQINQKITQPLTSMAKKIGELSVKIVSPQQAKIQAETKNLPQTPIKITDKQKKLTTGQLQQVSDSSSTMKRQSPQESINRAEEIRRMTSGKIKALEQTFNSKVVKPREVKKGYKEPGIIGGMIEEIKLGTISTLGNIGAGIEMEGRKINEKSLDGKDMVTKFLLTNVGRKISVEADNIMASNPEWMSDPKEGWSARKIARLGAGAAPSILINIAATIATLPAGGIGGYATGYLMEGGATYKEAKKMGVDEKKAQFYGTTVGVVNSIFEHIMPGSLSFGKKISKEVLKESAGEVSKSLAKDALKKLGKFGLSIAKNGALEGSTEGIQELWSNIIATNYDKNRKPWDNIIESVVGGFIGGGVAGGGTEEAVQQTGLIPDGTYTPEQMIGKIVSSKLSNTKEGNELVKTALQAQEAGQSIEIQNTVNSKLETVNQEETKVEKPKVEYTDRAIKKLQDQIDTILNIDPNIKGFKQKQKEFGISFQMTNEASDAGDPQAQADIKKIVELQRQIEDMRDARQFYLKSKKTKKSAKEYVESKVKERSVKFRESQDVKDIKMKEGTDLLMAIEDNIDKISDPNKNKLAIDDRAELSDIANRLANNKETANDKLTAYEILQRNKIDVGQKVAKSTAPKFREDPNQTQTLEELLAIKKPNIEQLKLINKMRAEQMAKSKEKSAENIGEERMGWKNGQKDEFDNALNMKNAEKVRKMLPEVPGYYKEEFKQKIDDVLNNDFTEETKILRGTKGMTADDIMKTYPNIQLKKDVPATDIYGNKTVIPEGEKLTPYELKGNKILLQDGETYIVTKNQFQNIKGQSKMAEGKPFAPELEGLEETVKGGRQQLMAGDIKWTESTKGVFDGELNGRKFVIKKEGDKFYVGEINGILGKSVNTYTQAIEEIEMYFKRDTPSTKYGSYTLPDGENYREILIKKPIKKDTRNIEMLEFSEKVKQKYNVTNPFDALDRGLLDPQETATLNRITSTPSTREDQFKSSHWSEPNVIAHLRMNDRTYNGEKVAFMEELQSDWAREARKAEKFDIRGEDMPTDVPTNPLLKNWQELTIKRALKDAVNSDAEYFAWINGEQTSNRYNLATQVKDVSWKNLADTNGEKMVYVNPIGTQDVINFRINTKGVISEGAQNGWEGKKLDEVLGKGLADKIMADESGTLSGEGLRFGGEWANTLYDKQVKNIVEDLTGGKVETIDMGLPVDKEVKRFLYNGNQGADIMAGDRVTADTIKVGQEIYEAGKSTNHIITEVLGEGKFKAISTSELFDMSGDERTQYISDLRNPGQYEKRLLQKNTEDSRDWINKQLENRKRFLDENSETFNISQKTTQQQALKLTPEIKARIKGEALQIETSGKMFEDAKFRVKDDVKRMTGKTITDAQEQELIDLNKKIFGDENVNITLQIMANSKALGKYEQNMIDILDGQTDPKATYLHEAVHKYLDVFSTSDEYTQVLEEGAVKYKTEDFAEVEEKIAEDFITYAKNKESAPKTITGKIKSFFDSVLERIKIYFGNRSAIDRLYSDIVEGKAVKKAIETAQENDPLIEEARKYKSAEEFVTSYNKKLEGFNAWDNDKEFTGLSGRPVTERAILHDNFMKIAQYPEYQKMYEQGKRDTDILTSIWNKSQEGTTQETKTDIPTNEIAQTPVGEGEKTKSKAYTRVYERLSEEARQDVSYNKLNLDKDADNALEFITSDPKSALRVSLGLEEAPAGMTETAISIAVADKAYRDGDNSLSSWLESSRSLRQTRRGQEIVSERGRFNEDSPHFFIREVMDRRLKNLGSNLKSALEELQGKAKSVKESAVEKIDKGVSKLKEKIKEDRKKIALAQDIIDSIIC